MKISQLLIAIGIVIIGFWVLGFVFKFVGWLINAALFIGAVLIVAGLISQFVASKKTKKLDQ